MGKFIDLLWKFEYPLSIILAFLVFFITLPKKKNFWISLIVGFLLIIGVSLVRLIPNIKKSDLFAVIFYFIIFAIMFGTLYFSIEYNDISVCLFILAGPIALQHICYKITVCIFTLIDPSYLSNTKIYLPAFAAILIVGCIISYFLFAKRIDITKLYTNSVYILIGILFLLISTVIVNYFEYEIFFYDSPRIKLISFLINFSSIITTGIIMMFLYSSAISLNRKRENEVMKLIADKDRERYELIKMTCEDINIKYHDLQHALKNKELDEELRKEIKESTTNYKAIINTSNRGLNVTIYESQLKCISKDIDLSVLIDGDPLQFMKSHHVYALLSNLLDNAIEAVEKIEEKEKRRISLKIYKKNNNIFINVTNFMSSPIKFVGDYPVTLKNDKFSHGYGIKSVVSIVNRYNGNLSLKTIDNQFIIDILIPVFSKD